MITVKSFAAMAAVLFLGLAGCETNHPDQVPYVADESAADLATVAVPAAAGGSYTGWWVKVCPKQTEAGWFRIAIGPDDHNVTQKVVWHTGDPLEFPLLHGHDYNQIYVVGYSGDDGKQVYLGLCHDAQVCCKQYRFNQAESSGGEAHLVKSDDTDTWNCQ
jgi:hypothetical protein